MWIISNRKIDSALNPEMFEGYYLYSDRKWNKCEGSNVLFHYEGYVLKRGQKPSSRASIDAELITLIAGNRLKPEMIKGNYTLVICRKDSFQVISDRFAVQKWFYWQNGDNFIISDNLKAIVAEVKPGLSKESMALYAISYHFINGKTLFKDVFHNEPAQMLEYCNGILTSNYYWSALSLLEQDRKDVDIKDIVSCLGSHIDDLIAYCGDDSISLSLTGGADTRNLLALMLSRGKKPHLYTYGNPASCDCVKARKISQGLGLSHHIYDIKMSSNTFKNYSKSIVSWGNALSSIHRAHRIMAVEQERNYAETMFLGTLGGEFVKGVSEDYYIVPDIIFDNWRAGSINNQDITRYLAKKSFNSTSVNLDNLNEEINCTFISGSVLQRKLKALTHLTAHLHDAQDIVLYQKVMKYVFTPFLDIDYLELLFASSFPFTNKELISNKIARRAQNPVYASNFIRTAYPQLGRFRYSGEHKPNEVLINPYLAALIKGIRQKFSRPYPPNFPVGQWMRDFVLAELPLCRGISEINECFQIDTMLREIEKEDSVPKESFWLKYTNPIMMKYIVEEMGAQ